MHHLQHCDDGKEAIRTDRYVTPSDVAAVSLQTVSPFSAGQDQDVNDGRDRPELLKSHLTIKHALLFETQILGGVGHYGEGGFGVMPEKKKTEGKKLDK